MDKPPPVRMAVCIDMTRVHCDAVLVCSTVSIAYSTLSKKKIIVIISMIIIIMTLMMMMMMMMMMIV